MKIFRSGTIYCSSCCDLDGRAGDLACSIERVRTVCYDPADGNVGGSAVMSSRKLYPTFFFQFFLLARESVLLLHHQFERGKSFFIGLMGSTSSVFEFNLSEKCMQMFVFKQENVFDFAFYSDIG